MCGIVGILGTAPVADRILESLRRLEYRGYDSAGIATLEGATLDRRRAPGKLGALADVLASDPLQGIAGIGHTRWATHGAPTVTNAHPHATARVAVVHNGIIENFKPLKDRLTAAGYVHETQTDTEVVAQLLTEALDNGMSPREAMAATLDQIEGAFGLAVLFAGEEDLMIGARRGSPLAVGYGDGETYLGSDAIALAPMTRRVSYLEEGDWAVLTRAGATIYDADGVQVEREITVSSASDFLVDKGNHRHFMMKEIHEQPEVISHTLSRYIDMAEGLINLPDADALDFTKIDRVSISACGTAFYAGLVARYWFEHFARLPVDIDIASEFRYREVPMAPGGLAVFISQSGETADTLATLRYCKEQGQKIAAVVNVPESTIARESDVIFQTLAGPEIGVASTKAFTCQLSVLACLVIAAGRQRGILTEDDERKLVAALLEVPRHVTSILKGEEEIETVSRDLAGKSHALYLGRNINYPIALEGALKLKEISYIHAEGYAAGELKHGPIALIDETMPVIMIAPYDRIFDKSISNMEEVAARGAQVILITDRKGTEAVGGNVFHTIEIPEAYSFVSPLLYTIPVQLLAYYTAVAIGTDVDQPRNLAKSVTVE
ncbi:MAG: glutamine--fructose-6-phosphate transaminase (isomerizing) [Pseudomonadota bacterium]